MQNSKMHVTMDIVTSAVCSVIGAIGLGNTAFQITNSTHVVSLIYLLYCIGFGLIVLRISELYKPALIAKPTWNWALVSLVALLVPFIHMIPDKPS